MRFVEPRLFADPDAADRKLVEIANGIEADGWPRERFIVRET